MKFDDFLKSLKGILNEKLVICNIGLPSQELYKIDDQPNYFYMLGSMGLSSSIGLGLSIAQEKQVISNKKLRLDPKILLYP